MKLPNFEQMEKILFLLPFPPPFSGPEMVSKELFETQAINTDASVRSLNSTLKTTNQDKGKMGIRGVWRFIGIYRRLLRHLFAVKVVFICLSSSRVGFLRDSIYILTTRLFGRVCVAQYHGSFFKHFYHKQPTYYQWWIRFSLNKLNLLLVLGQNLKSIFEDCYRGQIDVLYNGLNIKSLATEGERNQTVFTIFFMGHLWYPKGFYDLIQAYKSLHKRYDNKIALCFAGERTGYQKGALEFLSEPWYSYYLKNGKQIANEIEDFIDHAERYNARYLGFVSDNEKVKSFQQADVFVLPSYSEGFSMSCLEAMAYALPVITTPVGAMPEVVEDKKNGLIVPVGQSEALETAIEKLMLDQTLYDEISNYNTSYVKENFDMENIAKRLIDLLKTMV